MIRILENGKNKVVTCACGCKYSFDTVDVKNLSENGTKGEVACPECGATNSVIVKSK